MKPCSHVSAALALLAIAACGSSGNRSMLDAGGPPSCHAETGTLACGKACLPSEEGGSCGLLLQNEQATCTNGVWVCGPIDAGEGSALDSAAGPTCQPETGTLPCGKACLPSEEGGGCGHISTNEQATCTHGTWVCGPMFYCTRASDAGVDSDAGTPTNCDVQDCSLACSRTCASSDEGITCHDVFAGEQATCSNGTWICGAH